MSYFPWFFICFLLLFYGTGVGNGSTFRQVIATDRRRMPLIAVECR